LRELSREKVDLDPFAEFDVWMNNALDSQVNEPTAMTLSTVSLDGRPASRVVLLKGFDSSGFVFFTNYNSRKGRQLADNPYAAINFFWPELERQVNISGRTVKVPAEESDEYFGSRPFTSRVGAWASNQSERIDSKMVVMARAAKLVLKYATGHVPRPPHWGGFRLVPDRFEFWQGRPSRLHDRICYERNGDAWEIFRLAP
jgi:pyridoxamine 5'-phosphate oxidase